MNKMVQVTAAKVSTSRGRTDHKLVNNRMDERTIASDESRKEKVTEQGDVIESGVGEQMILDRMVSEGI